MALKKVEVLIIGAQKAGTTSLCAYMSQHPRIDFSLVKETNYFIDEKLYSWGSDYYHSFFPEETQNSIRASACVHMLACRESPERVRRYNPGMLFIVILREPVDRAWSAFNYAKQKGWEASNIDFVQAVELESSRRVSKDHRERRDLAYIYNGLYWRHLEYWTRFFPIEQFLVLRTEDLRDRPDETLRRVWQFVGVRSDEKIDAGKKHNVASETRAVWFSRFISRKNSRIKLFARKVLPRRSRVWLRANLLPSLVRLNTRQAEPTKLEPKVRTLTAKYFREDAQRLEEDFGIRFNSHTGKSSSGVT